MVNEIGIYRLDGTFESEASIKRRLYLEGHHPEPDFRTPRSIQKTFQDYSEQFRQQQTDRGETYKDYAEIQFFETPLINFQSDLHIGGEHTDYNRIEQEAELIVNTPNSFVILMGDLVDNFSFNPPAHETLDIVPEQIRFARELIKYYANNKKLLAVWQGNHDYWSMRQGVELYDYLLQDIDTYYFFGIGYLDAIVLDEQFKICASHQFPGHSMYTTSHPQNRAYRFGGAWGSDIVVSGHWHDKGINVQSYTGYKGVTTNATLMALGTYKFRDGYTRNKAFEARNPKSAYGASVILHEDTHTVQPFYDIVEAHRRFLE
jgi:predicted phosphodiesterase